jgi:nucleotide-binding universal stress UspA family protein
MYVNVVVGINGLSGDRDAIALAKALAPASVLENARLALVNVRLLDTVPTRGSNGAFEASETDASHKLLERQRSAFAEGAEVVTVAALSVGRGLHQVAEDRGADLIVVGGCHRGPVGRVLAGDDTRAALHQAPCAVAVAPAGYGEGSTPIGTIGVAYDTSVESEVALAHSALLAGALGAQLKVREVIELHVYGAAGWASAATMIEDPDAVTAAVRERIGSIPGAEIDVALGPVLIELAGLSGEVDLLVCGSRQHGAAKRVLLGSTSDFLSRHAQCPLLVTPARDAEHVAAWHELSEGAAV